MMRRNWLMAITLAALLGSVLPQEVRAGFWNYHHCPKPSYCRLNYWTPNLVTGVALLNPHPRYLYATDQNVGVPYGYVYRRFPCPETYPQTLYSFPLLDRPKLPKPVETPENK